MATYVNVFVLDLHVFLAMLWIRSVFFRVRILPSKAFWIKIRLERAFNTLYLFVIFSPLSLKFGYMFPYLTYFCPGVMKKKTHYSAYMVLSGSLNEASFFPSLRQLQGNWCQIIFPVWRNFREIQGGGYSICLVRPSFFQLLYCAEYLGILAR